MTAADAREPINRRRFLMLAGGTIVAVSCSSEPASELGSSTTLPGSGSSSTTVAALQARLFANDGSDKVPSAPPGEVGRVIVVGAGLAGLTAARALHLSGAEVLVLEGRERIGGRTHTSHLGDAAVDLGAAWVHPGNESALAPLFSAIEVPLLPAGLTDLVLQARVYDRSSGSYPDSAAANTLLSLLAPLALGDPNDVLTGPADETLGAVIDRLAAQASGDPQAVAGAANATKGLFGLYGGSNVDTEVATLFLGEGPDETGSDDETGEEGGDVDRLPQGGFRTIIEALAEGLDIRLGVGVDSIVETDSGVAVTSDGEEFAGSHVVATVPLGVLKSEAIRFDPPLDQAKQTAMERIGFGAFEKVALQYEEPWWQIDGQPAPIVVANPDTRGWSLILDLSAWYGSPVLVALTGGDHARDVARLSDEERIAQVAELVGELAPDRTAPKPTAALATNWTSSPFSNGCYSNLTDLAGSEDDFAVLGEPAGRVLFAGEATIRDEHSTVEGAWLSGIREAKRLLQVSEVPVL